MWTELFQIVDKLADEASKRRIVTLLNLQRLLLRDQMGVQVSVNELLFHGFIVCHEKIVGEMWLVRARDKPVKLKFHLVRILFGETVLEDLFDPEPWIIDAYFERLLLQFWKRAKNSVDKSN